MVTYHCSCGWHTNKFSSLAKHKQYCEKYQAQLVTCCNFLHSTASESRVDTRGSDGDANINEFSNDNGEHYGDSDDDDYVEELLQDKDELDDLIDDLVYDAASDDDDDDDDDDADNHSATMSVHIPPSEITDLLREHDEAMNNWEDFNDDGMYNFDDSNVDRSDMNYGDDDDSDNSYMSGFSNDHDVQFEPSIFATQPQYFSAVYRLQVALNTLLDKNKASIEMYDEIVKLVNGYIASPHFSRMAVLKPRKQFIKETETLFAVDAMKPMHGQVKLTDNTIATVPAFDAKTMILSLLHDPSLMKEENFAEGYDIFTGEELDGFEGNTTYGEIHTGDAWEPSLRRFCGDSGRYMPVALVLFGDKSHTDLHGLLSVEPVSFTLSLFNRKARNLPQFWRLLGYIPNLSAGKGDANRMPSKDKLQNQHSCLSYIFQSLIKVVKDGGIRTIVMGRQVHIKIWIHFIIGDTEGNNKWLGHYPGNNCGVVRPYRDCECSFVDMSKPDPRCVYTTMTEMHDAYSIYHRNEQEGIEFFRSISRYPIVNALLQPGLPLSDHMYGPFRMTPPELLHTSGAGLIMYLFQVMASRMGGGILRNELDMQSIRMQKSLRRQSQRDFPRGATRNGIIDGTRCQASERRGNLFVLACISFTTEGMTVLKQGLGMTDNEWRSFQLLIRQYLALEEWYHAENDKDEVRNARRKIAKVLKMLQLLFSRGEGTNGWNIPKMHGMTKMQSYMLLFGSGMNFYGGPGESSHKQFVKAPGLKTQRRVSEFAVQTAKQYHNVMITRHALTCIKARTTDTEIDESTEEGRGNGTVMEGKYEINTSDTSWEENWSHLHDDLLQYYCRNKTTLCRKSGPGGGTTITGYTRGRHIDDDGDHTIFYAHPNYRGSPWYDWAYVHFVERGEEVYYLSKILGFVQLENSVEAVIQCSVRPMNWETLEKKMFVGIELGVKTESFVTVKLSSIVYSLCVIKDYGGGKNKYIVVLPRCAWGQYFGGDII